MYFGVWMLNILKRRPAAPVETFARFQACFLSSEDFHRILSIFMGFQRFSQIFIDFNGFSCISGYGCLTDLRQVLLPLQKPLLDSRLASCHLRTFIVLYGFSWIFIDFHCFNRFSCISGYECLSYLRQDLLPLQKPLLDSRLASCHLRTFIVFH